MKDLALLVADKNMDFALRGILQRHESLGIRAVTYETQLHAGRDGGVRASGPETLSLLRDQFNYGIVMLDMDGSGTEEDSAIALEDDLNGRLAHSWGDRAKAIVIEPELDAWVWGSDHAMAEVLGWSEDLRIREWLARQGHGFHPNHKPLQPKEALEMLMFRLSEPRSSALYARLTAKISLARCIDPAFNRLKSTLQSWFHA
jgi:hypothetical protein